jgi:hypothetical protein
LIKKTLTRPDYFLIAANLLPVAGVWIFGWSPKEVFMVYALETVIIGLFNLLKMGVVTAVRKTDTWYNGPSRTQQSGLFFMFFFLIHYGLFVAVQTGMFIQVSGIGKEYNAGFFDFFIHWPRYLGPDAYYMLAGFYHQLWIQYVLEFYQDPSIQDDLHDAADVPALWPNFHTAGYGDPGKYVPYFWCRKNFHPHFCRSKDILRGIRQLRWHTQ